MVQDSVIMRLDSTPMDLIQMSQGYQRLVEELVIQGQTSQPFATMVNGQTIGQIKDLYQKELVAKQQTQNRETYLLTSKVLVSQGVKLWSPPTNSRYLIPCQSDEAMTVGTTQARWHCRSGSIGE